LHRNRNNLYAYVDDDPLNLLDPYGWVADNPGHGAAGSAVTAGGTGGGGGAQGPPETTATNSASYSGIGSTGVIGESALQQLGGTSQYYFSTSLGGRYVDQFVDDVANESKVGYTSLTQSVQLQIAKDTELLQTGNVQGVTWNFFTSPVTGRGGPSGPLYNALQNAGFGVVINK
jgi:filamentous hemagglutinin